MNVKTFIAREYLYLLGFTAAWVSLYLVIGLLFYPEVVPHPGLPAPATFSAQDKLRLDELMSKYSDSSALVATPRLVTNREKRQLLDLLRKEKESKSPMTLLYLEELDEHRKFQSKQDLIDNLLIAALVIPYPIYLFIRTIVWSIRRVRRHPLQSKG